MSITFMSGLEIHEAPPATGFESVAASANTYDTSIVRTGTYSVKMVPVSGVSGGISIFNAPTTGYVRFSLRVTARPSTTARIVFGQNAAGVINLRLNSDGTIAFYVQTTLIGTSTTALTDTSHWYQIEVRTVDGTSVTVLQIDGVSEVTGSPSTWTFGSGLFGARDAVADTYTIYLDDVVWDNAAFPGDLRVVMLIPTADSAVGAGWTLGTGTAISSNGFDSVNNLPPLGVADLAAGSDPKQLRNASANANTSYDATMTTYAAAGLAQGDVVAAVYPVVATSAPVSTSAKQGTLGVVSNPTIANVALGSGGIAGAFWAGSAGAAWAGGWKISLGTVATSPSVTLGTAPVMRITQVTSSTRIAVICLMYIFVAYTPGSRYPKALNVQQARNRASSY